MHRTPRLLGAAVLTLGLVSAGTTTIAHGSSAGDDPGLRSDPAPTVALPDGDAVALVAHEGRTIIEPRPRPDGTTPGLVVATGPDGTSIQATDSDAAPTRLTGSPLTGSAPDGDDLVELRFDAIARDGREGVAHVNVFDVESGEVVSYRTLPGNDAECTTAVHDKSSCILVPPGTYSLMAYVTTMPAAEPSGVKQRTVQNVSLVGSPEVEVTRDRTFTFDARKARKVDVRTPGRRTKVNASGAMLVEYTRTAASGRVLSVMQRPTAMLDPSFYLQPTARVRTGAFDTLTRLRLEAPDIELSTPRLGALHPEYYDRVWFSDVSSQFPMYDGRARLRVVDVGRATPEELAGRNLRGAVAVAERSDDLAVAEQSNAAAQAGARLMVIHSDQPGDSADPNGAGIKLAIPTVRLRRAEGLALKRRGGSVTVRGESVTPYVYDLVLKEHGRIPRDPGHVVRTGQLASQVREFHGQPTKDMTASEAAYQWQPEDQMTISSLIPLRGGAQTRTEYRIPDPDTRWSYSVSTPETHYNTLFPGEKLMRMQLSVPRVVAYPRASRTHLPVATAPITATPNPVLPVERSGDRMRVDITGFVDGDSNYGRPNSSDSGMSTHLQIRADGVVVGDTTARPVGIAAVPAGESRMEIEFTAENPQSWADLSTFTETRWAFDSVTAPEDAVVREPLILADYDVDVDLRNRARARSFDLSLGHAEGARASRVDVVELEASYDGGRSWRRAAVGRERDGARRVTLPRGSGFVSLRLHAADRAGSTLDQTVLRAWYVASSGGSRAFRAKRIL